jgi:outer membrane protein insertion porin family
MKSNIFSRLLLLGLLLVSHGVKGDEEFVVKDIQVKGLQRISLGTVYNYLPVNVGEKFLPPSRPCLKQVFLKMCHWKGKVQR